MKAPRWFSLPMGVVAVVVVGCSPSGSEPAARASDGSSESCAVVIAISGRQYIGGRQSDVALPLTDEKRRAQRLTCDDMGEGAGTSMTTVVATTIEGVPVEDAVAANGLPADALRKPLAGAVEGPAGRAEAVRATALRLVGGHGSDHARAVDQCDVVVVGGRVAGSLAAILFARAGLDVVVVDRATFPSPTLSTHFFRGDGLIRVLDRAGLLPDVEALGAPRLTREYVYANGDAGAALGPPQEPGRAGYDMSVRRVSLDVLLVEGARESGVRVLTATAVTDLVSDDGRVTGVVLADGRTIGGRAGRRR